jgi:hypothetical protein
MTVPYAVSIADPLTCTRPYSVGIAASSLRVYSCCGLR